MGSLSGTKHAHLQPLWRGFPIEIHGHFGLDQYWTNDHGQLFPCGKHETWNFDVHQGVPNSNSALKRVILTFPRPKIASRDRAIAQGSAATRWRSTPVGPSGSRRSRRTRLGPVRWGPENGGKRGWREATVSGCGSFLVLELIPLAWRFEGGKVPPRRFCGFRYCGACLVFCSLRGKPRGNPKPFWGSDFKKTTTRICFVSS